MLPTLYPVVSGAILVLVTLGWLYYLSLIPKEKVPPRPIGFALLMGISVLAILGLFGFGYIQQTPPRLLSWVLGVSAIVLAVFFLYLLSQAPLPDQPICIKVGEKLPPITALDGFGNIHRSSNWKGQRVLFKFFRGSW